MTKRTLDPIRKAVYCSLFALDEAERNSCCQFVMLTSFRPGMELIKDEFADIASNAS